METFIKVKSTINKMSAKFENSNSIRFFEIVGSKEKIDASTDIDKNFMFSVKIRHAENVCPKLEFKNIKI